MGKILQLADETFKWAGENADFIAGLFLVAGICLAALSPLLGVANILWDGEIGGQTIEGFDGITAKQVGYIWAPNWALASIIILPLALRNLLLARQAIDPLISTLVQTDMLRSTGGSSVDRTKLDFAWKKTSTRWSFASLLIFLAAAAFTIFGDFFVVVWQWNFNSNEMLEEFSANNPLQLSHPVFEFDWSIAAAFTDPPVGPLANSLFALAAYLLVAVIGAGFLLSGFVWMICFCIFFSRPHLRKHQLILAPDTNSTDRRMGFERFEELFDHLVQAALFTSILALTMHLQNVFLRSPTHETIIQMVFGEATQKFAEFWDEVSLVDIWSFLTTVEDALGVKIDGANFNIFISAVAMILIAVIVVGFVWTCLRRAALDGAQHVLENPRLGDDDRDRIHNMEVWPVGWISLNLLAIIVFIIFMSMYFVNFVSLIVLGALVFFAAQVVTRIIRTVFSGRSPRRPRRPGD
jgi:hypothetical protein